MCPKMQKLIDEGREFDPERLFCDDCCEPEKHNHFPAQILPTIDKQFGFIKTFFEESEKDFTKALDCLFKYTPSLHFLKEQSIKHKIDVDFHVIDYFSRLKEIREKVQEYYNKIRVLANDFDVLAILKLEKEIKALYAQFKL